MKRISVWALALYLISVSNQSYAAAAESDEGETSARGSLSRVREAERSSSNAEQMREFYEDALKNGKDLMPFKSYAALLMSSDSNKEEARKFYEVGARYGDVTMQSCYAAMCYGGRGGDKDLVEARKYYHLAGAKGDAIAQLNYADMCYAGEGGDKDLVEARKHYHLAGVKFEAIAQLKYALMCYKGEGGDADLRQALFFSSLSASKGGAMAYFLHAQILYNYQDVTGERSPGLDLSTPDKDMARYNYKKAADKGHRGAQLAYAKMCRLGEGGDRNLLEAMKYNVMARFTSADADRDTIVMGTTAGGGAAAGASAAAAGAATM